MTSIGAAGFTVTFSSVTPATAAGEIDKPDMTVSTEGLGVLDDPHSYPAGIVPGYDLEGARRERERARPLELDE